MFSKNISTTDCVTIMLQVQYYYFSETFDRID